MEPRRVSHYQIERLIARGGMGEVFEAVDLALGRRVALKFVAPELAADSETLKRFEREALAAAALNHPHIATLYAMERDADRPFIAMELLTGPSLRAHLGGGVMPLDEAAAIIREVADALAYAHRRGVVHRDIKPENLMFDEHQRIKITDFGLARVSHSATVTVSGVILGTASYMAPECARGETGTPSDVFALGVMFHELLSGRQPFVGDGPLATLFAIANQEPAPLRSLRPEVPEAVEALTLRMLAKAPEDRPTAAEVCAALGGRPSSNPTDAITVAIESAAPATRGLAATPPPATSIEPVPAVKKAPPRGLLMLGLMVALGLAAVLLIWPGIRSRRAREALGNNNRGVEALQRGDLEQARTFFEQAIALDPRLGSAMINLGMVHMSQGQVPRAESLFTLALRRYPKDPGLVAQARYNLGTIDLDTQTWESAAQNLGASFAIDSSSARIYNNYGLALLKVGRTPEALALLERGIERFPTTAPLHKNIGLALIDLGRTDEAATHLDRAVALDSSLVEARELRAGLERSRHAP